MPHQIIGPGSITRRPDSISHDYTMAHAFGPVNLGDNTKGMLNRVWRARTDGMNLWLARGNDTFNGYDAEVLLVTIPNGQPPITELDLAFDQNARITVCTERLTGPLDTPEIWLYWFDPTVVGYTYSAMAYGRNPRAILDEPIPQSQTSDVLIWFFSNSNQVLAYRRQRDRYQTEFYINSITADNKFVEDVYRSIDNRVHVLISVHNIPPGTYDLDHVESTLYPFWPPAEGLTTSLTMLPFTGLRSALIDYVAQPDGLTAGVTINLGAGGLGLVDALLTYDQHANDHEDFQAGIIWQGGLLVIALITHDQTLGEPEALKAGLTLPSATLAVALFEFTQPADGMTAGVTITGGTLGP